MRDSVAALNGAVKWDVNTKGDAMPIRMEVSRILIRETDDHHVVELREVDGERIFPILIGIYEAAAIERRLMGNAPPRPYTHELLASVIEALDAEIDHVLISDLQDHTFYARLKLKRGDTLVDVDSRPSDAIALGIATEVPIFVAEHVLEEVSPGQ